MLLCDTTQNCGVYDWRLAGPPTLPTQGYSRVAKPEAKHSYVRSVVFGGNSLFSIGVRQAHTPINLSLKYIICAANVDFTVDPSE